MSYSIMSDPDILYSYCEQYRMTDPRLMAQIRNRGLLSYISLPFGAGTSIGVAKCIMTFKMIERGLITGNEEIDDIKCKVERLKKLRAQANNIEVWDYDRLGPILEETMDLSRELKEYFN